MPKKRIDQLLVEKKLTESRNKALRLVLAKKVKAGGRLVTKPAELIDEDLEINIEAGPKYVGRGAEKLESVARAFKISFSGKTVADIGASTGGFTDFVLQNGAEKVYSIDSGYGQLDYKLRNDKRVINMERTNIRNVEKLPEEIDIFTIDVSFISLRKVLLQLRRISLDADIIALFKPQFEVGKEIADRYKGIIKDENERMKALGSFKKWLSENNFKLKGEIESPILGAKGNKEYLLWIK